MLDFLSEKTRVPFVHGSIFFSTLMFTGFVFWNVFSTVPVFLTSVFFFFWFFLTFFLGIFSHISSVAFPYLFTFLPSTKKRDRFVPMRAVAYALATLFVALSIGVCAPIVGAQLFSFGRHFIAGDTLFITLFVVAMLVAYGVGLHWAGLLSSSSNTEQKIHIPFVYRYSKVLSDSIYAAFSFMVDAISFLWLPLLSVLLLGDVLYGAYILFAFATGRMLPVLILSLYAGFHVDVSSWLLERRKTVRYAVSGVYIFVSVFFLSFSAQIFTQILPFFREHVYTTQVVVDSLLPLLLILPFWLHFFSEFRRVFGTAQRQLSEVRTHIDMLVRIKNHMYAHCLSSLEHAQTCLPRVEKDLVQLAYQADMLSSAVRHRLNTPLRAQSAQKHEERSLWGLLVRTSFVSAAIIAFYYIFL